MPSCGVEVSAELSSALSLPPEAWQELLALCQDETADRALLERLLDLCRAAQGGGGTALYLEREGRMELELASSAEAAGLAGSAGHLAQPVPGGLPRSIGTGDGLPAGASCRYGLRHGFGTILLRHDPEHVSLRHPAAAYPSPANTCIMSRCARTTPGSRCIASK